MPQPPRSNGPRKPAGRSTGRSSSKAHGSSQRKTGSRTKHRLNRGGATSTPGKMIIPDGAKVFRIGPEHGIDLAHFLSEANSSMSVRAVRRALDKGICWVNGRIETYGSRRLYRGDVIAVLFPGAPGASDHSATWQLEKETAFSC